MSIKFKFVDHHAARKDGAAYLQEAILPLLAEQWEKTGQDIYGTALSFNLEQFSTLWLTGGLVTVIAYEDDTPVGLFIGIPFRPILFDRRVLMVEQCYGKTAEVESAIYKYITGLLPMLNVDEVWVQGDINHTPQELDGMQRVRQTMVYHFARV